ncbi:Clp protease N-terminal domain-containing protein [Actinoplanes oblitus]|uniref:Clp protease N-terminal domain-containing protein n=1 Tax=Actinoplanes oblitus TaxID=3040509 RepID=A0ABY8W6S1_9ACTN|nr:Clp protease N-terminal domain-containing protein [Actinoplanes oblitus]WIM93368.1 Clp protease N-terminal domain-containing protein [Actinoplanes oblitus]
MPPHPEWTGLARRVADRAGQEAASRGHRAVRSEHYLFALLDVDRTAGILPALILEDLDVPVDRLRRRLDEVLRTRLPDGSDLPGMLLAATAEAELLASDYLGAEHLLLGVAVVGNGVLAEFGGTPERIRDGLDRVLRSYGGGPRLVTPPPEIRDLDELRAPRTEAATGEVERLRGEVRRLTELLRAHGIEP